MKTTSFRKHLAKLLSQEEIREIEEQARIEIEVMQSLQKDISQNVTNYMAHENIGFNELVRRLGVSPAQAIKIKQGTANLTLASLAHIAALFKTHAKVTFEAVKH